MMKDVEIGFEDPQQIPLFDITNTDMNMNKNMNKNMDSTDPLDATNGNGNADTAAAAAAGQQTPPPEDYSRSNSASSFSKRFEMWRNTRVIIAFILFLGIASSSTLLAVGITFSRAQQETQFKRGASDVRKQIESQFAEYENAASFVHNRCRSRNFTRIDFREMYEYLINAGLDFKAVQFDPNVTREERPVMEAEAREYYAANYPDIQYRGFVGFDDGIAAGLVPRAEQDFYFPIHYMEPIPGNVGAIDLDYYSHVSRRQSLEFCFETGQPAVTDRLVLVKTDDEDTRCGAGGDASYGVVLMHPGVNLTTQRDSWPRDLSSLVVCIPILLGSAVQGLGIDSAAYIYDASASENEPPFLGGVIATGEQADDLVFLPETPLDDLDGTGKLYSAENIIVANKVWTVAVVALDGAYRPQLIFVILGTIVTFAASLCLAFWVWHSTRRMTKFNQMKADSDLEKAALILENARQATKAERELNDFIGHEVRNPVSAAMAACSFVKSAISKPEPVVDEELRKALKDDVDIIDNSLRFVNDLLRNMLDMHRAATKQLKVTLEPTDLLHDVLEPVAGMLHQRGSNIKVIVDCPPNLYVMTDNLRLKQVILNLGRNSSKFISTGFIRLRAKVVDGLIRLSVDDSGTGIPEEKRELLFSKFQESLDVLSQGTGIGLFLCKTLTSLMGGEIYLDDDYDSGIKGFPGTSFVIDMKRSPLDPPAEALANESANRDLGSERHSSNQDLTNALDNVELPEKLKVLFVDDDAILRKLFCRSIKTVAPSWTFREAANGETALLLVETEQFDLIFMDMYMASAERQLLGTEAVVELRNRGTACRICGLSANDKEAEFLEAGANAFTLKPFPCDKNSLTQELCRVLFTESKEIMPLK